MKRKPHFSIEYRIPTEAEIQSYIGEIITINGKKVMVESITGSKKYPLCFEINHNELVSVIRFFNEVLDAGLTEDEMRQFEMQEFASQGPLDQRIVQ